MSSSQTLFSFLIDCCRSVVEAVGDMSCSKAPYMKPNSSSEKVMLIRQ